MKREYNRCFARGPVRIENAFATLKGSWRILKNLNVGLRAAAQTVIACCVLHNFCILAGEPALDAIADPYPLDHGAQVPALPDELHVSDLGELHVSDLGDQQRDNLFQ